MAATLRIDTLGRCAAFIDGRQIGPNAEIMLAILLLLGLRRGKAWRRTDLAEILWPNAGRATRASRLRWLLAKLRALGFEIENNAADVRLALADVRLDIDDIDHLAPNRIGRILPFRSTRLSTAFLAWMDEQRSTLLAEAMRRLKPRLRALTHRQASSDVIALATVILELDALDEAATLSMAEALFNIGLRTEAIATLESFITACGDDSPELQLQANVLLRRIRSVDEAGESCAEPKFVGRVEELRRIDALLYDARRGQGGALVLAGPAGIGKTRLLDEARSRAMMAGMQVIRVSCRRLDPSRPLAWVIDFLPHLLEMRGAAGCHPQHLARLREFSNRGAGEYPVAMAGPDPATQGQRRRLLDALVDALASVSSETPLLLQFDDAPIDKSDKSLCDKLLSSCQSLPIAWLFTLQTRRREGPALPAAAISVGALEIEFAAELAADLTRVAARRADSATLQAILARGAGSPLFIRELAREWNATGSANSLPKSLMGLIDRGLSGLGKRALRVLHVAALLGTRGTIDRLEHVCSFPRAGFIDALVELDACGILTADCSGRTFGHVLWADAALAGLSPTIAALLHRRVAECLDAGSG